MAYTGESHNEAFNQGVYHTQNSGSANESSITLDGSLQADSDHWDVESQQAATSPHSVLAPYSFSRSATNGTDGQNMLPNGMFLGSSDGMSGENFENSLSLRYAGSNDNLP